MSFVHLHTHSEYSPLDSIARVSDLVDAAKLDGQVALAVTDHGTLAGAWDLAVQARRAGITPIMGIEAYLAIGSRWEKNTRPVTDPTSGQVREKRYEHVVLLAQTGQGWKNLLRIHNASQQTRFDTRWPRIDYDLIGQHREGIILLTGCLGGPILGPMARGDRAAAAHNLDRMIECVGRANVYVEVMEHAIPAETRILPDVVALAREKGVRIVATNDAHFVQPGLEEEHSLWLAKKTRTSVKDPHRWRFTGEGYHLRSEAEMRALRAETWWQEACDETALLADRISPNVLPPHRLRLPHFPTPAGFESSRNYFDHLLQEGVHGRYGQVPGCEVRERVRREVDVIATSGMVDYFLIVHEMVTWAREVGIMVGPGRGSAAGSVVAYCLGITQVDPIRHGLLFERFLDPTRVGMPDIDTDFEQGRRSEVIRHLRDLYGQDHVAHIGTFQVCKTKAALRAAGQVLAVANALTDRLAKAVPMDGASPYTFAQIDAAKSGEAGEFWKIVDSDPRYADLVRLARVFEDLTAAMSTHACGVVVSDEPLTGLVPLWPGKDPSPGAPMVTEWDAAGVEKGLGLLKLDVLGLRNLDIVGHARAAIGGLGGQVPGVLPDPDCLSDETVAATYDLIGRGHTQGLFQMGSRGMTELAQEVAPRSFEHLTALVALYRPGPMEADIHTRYARRKNGLEAVDYSIFSTVPAEQVIIAKVLDSTYGLTVYQEQAMELGRVVAGFGPVEVNALRVAISKKLEGELARIGELFVEGAAAGRGGLVFGRECAQRLWATVAGAARYAFNKSHAAAYARLVYVTAWLKAAHGAAYGGAVLAATSDADKRVALLVALRREGVTVAGPDVNLSGVRSSATGDGTIRLGLAEVRDVGKCAAAIVAEREHGPFESLADLILRTEAAGSAITKSALEGLIESGACDGWGTRRGHLAVVGKLRKNPALPIPDMEWGLVERAIREHHRLGVIVGEHPLRTLRDQVVQWRPDVELDWGESVSTRPIPVHRVVDCAARTVATVGLVTGWKRSTGRRGTTVDVTLDGSGGSLVGRIWESALLQVPEGVGVGSVVGALVNLRRRDYEREVEVVDEDGQMTAQVRRDVFVNVSVVRLWPVEFVDRGGWDNSVELEPMLPGLEQSGVVDVSGVPVVGVAEPAGGGGVVADGSVCDVPPLTVPCLGVWWVPPGEPVHSAAPSWVLERGLLDGAPLLGLSTPAGGVKVYRTFTEGHGQYVLFVISPVGVSACSVGDVFASGGRWEQVATHPLWEQWLGC